MFYKLKELREKSKLSTSDMGKILNISKSYYSQIENCKRKLSYSLAILIADNFKLKPDEIFYDDFKKKK